MFIRLIEKLQGPRDNFGVAGYHAATNGHIMNEPSIRDGEIAVDLPESSDASLYFIGRIRTPWKQRKDCPKNARESEAVCTIEVDPRWAAALKDVESCSHLVVLYWMDKSRRDIVL